MINWFGIEIIVLCGQVVLLCMIAISDIFWTIFLIVESNVLLDDVFILACFFCTNLHF